MKKTILLLFLCFTCICSACSPSKNPANGQSNGKPDGSPDTSGTSNQGTGTTPDDTGDSSNGNETIVYEPGVLYEITDDRITIVDNKKVYNSLGVTVSVPSEWKCMGCFGEDGSYYTFQHPELGDKCQLSLDITLTDYLSLAIRTESKYLEYLSDNIGEDVKINSFKEETLSGQNCLKVMYSYTKDNIEYTCVDYRYIAVGYRLYSFQTIYSSSEKETMETVFQSIMDSIAFSTSN